MLSTSRKRIMLYKLQAGMEEWDNTQRLFMHILGFCKRKKITMCKDIKQYIVEHTVIYKRNFVKFQTFMVVLGMLLSNSHILDTYITKRMIVVAAILHTYKTTTMRYMVLQTFLTFMENYKTKTKNHGVHVDIPEVDIDDLVDVPLNDVFENNLLSVDSDDDICDYLAESTT